MKFNINDYVKVKLTEFGMDILRKQHKELKIFWPGLPDFEPPKEDKDGWSEHQLWTLMSHFGHTLSNGGEVPFELEIEIPVKEDK